MYASPILVNFETLFDLLYRALSNHPQDQSYIVMLGKTFIPEGMGGDEVYQKYGPCGPCPWYHLCFFLETTREQVEVEEPFSYMSVSKKTLDNIPELDEKIIGDFSGNSFVFTPSTYQKSALYDQTEPLMKKNEWCEWKVLPEVCLDKGGKMIFREDCY